MSAVFWIESKQVSTLTGTAPRYDRDNSLFDVYGDDILVIRITIMILLFYADEKP